MAKQNQKQKSTRQKGGDWKSWLGSIVGKTSDESVGVSAQKSIAAPVEEKLVAAPVEEKLVAAPVEEKLVAETTSNGGKKHKKSSKKSKSKKSRAKKHKKSVKR
jgi:hypothetical protein